MTKLKPLLIAMLSLAMILCTALFIGMPFQNKILTARAADETPDSEVKTYNVVLTQGTIEADGISDTSTGSRVAELNVREGSVVTITAPEKSNAVFDKWTYSANFKITFEDENSATTTFTMPQGDVWIECKFKYFYNVTVKDGTLESGKTSGSFIEGSTVKIIASATLGGKSFVKWFVASDEVTFEDENSSTTTFVMPKTNVEITAIYQSEHNLVFVDEKPATCTENGTKEYYFCTVEGCGKMFTDETETVEITDESMLIIPMAHSFGEWVEEVPATTETHGVKGHKDCKFCHKHFDKDGNEITDLTFYKTYKVYLRQGTIEADGIIDTSTGSRIAQLDVREGTIVTIMAQEKADVEFKKWTYTAVVKVTLEDENSATTTFVMPQGDVWFDCEYKIVRTVTVEKGIGGGEIEVGQTVTVTANEAPEGKEFDKWVVVSGEVTLEDENSATTTFVMPNGAVEIKATYKEKAQDGADSSVSSIEEPTENNGLSGGAIAGIVAGSVVVAGFGGFSIFWFVIKKKSFAELIAIFKK